MINGVLSEKHSLDGQVAVSNKLYSNQSVYVYDKKGTFIFTSEEDTDSPPGMSEVNKLKSVSYKGKRGFLYKFQSMARIRRPLLGMLKFSMIWNLLCVKKASNFSIDIP